MKHERAMERRQFLKGTLGVASLVTLAGCDNLTQSSWFPSILQTDLDTGRLGLVEAHDSMLVHYVFSASAVGSACKFGSMFPNTCARCVHVFMLFGPTSAAGQRATGHIRNIACSSASLSRRMQPCFCAPFFPFLTPMPFSTSTLFTACSIIRLLMFT